MLQGAYGGQIRLASVPVSTKAMLQKLPLRVYRRLEEVVTACDYLEWRHFDAGVVKVRGSKSGREEAVGWLWCLAGGLLWDRQLCKS